MQTESLSGNVKGRDHLEDLTTNGKIILDLKEIRQGIC
jgi:hypothetical protein